MWLRNTKNNTFYPYHDIMAKHHNMEVIQENPFFVKREMPKTDPDESLPIKAVEDKPKKTVTKKSTKAKAKVATPRGKR